MLITYVKSSGPFIKIYGRVEVQRKEFAVVEAALANVVQILFSGMPPELRDIKEGDICVAFSDMKYKRARILNVSDKGFVNIYAMDYGNKEIVTILQVCIF